MSRIIGDLDFPDGGRTGLKHTDQLVCNASQGIELDSYGGGLSGIVTNDIFFWAGGAISGQAQNTFALLSSGNIIIEARPWTGLGEIQVSGGNINLNAETDILAHSNSRDITWQAERDVSVTAIQRDVHLTSNRRDVLIDTSQVFGGGAVRIIPNTALHFQPSQEIFARTPTRLQMFAFGGQAIISGQTNAGVFSVGNIHISGQKGIILQTTPDTSFGDISLFSSGVIYQVAGTGNIIRDAWNGSLLDSAAHNITLITHSASDGDIILQPNHDSVISPLNNLYHYAQSNAIVSGLSNATLTSANQVNVSGQTGLNLFAGPNAAAQINVSGISDLNIGSSAGNAIIEIRGTNKFLHIRGAGTNDSIHICTNGHMDLQSTNPGGAGTNGDIVITPGGDLIVKPDVGAIKFTARSIGTNTTDGKSIFSNVVSNNKAPITVSGVNQVESLMTGATAGDLGFQNAGIESGPGAGRFWFNSGSGMAPLAMGSGFFLAYDSLVGSPGVSIGTLATGMGFNTQIVRDRQFQHNPTSSTASGTIIVTNAGLYRIHYNASFTHTAASVATAVFTKCQIYINNSAYNPSVAYAACEGTNNTSFGCAATTYAFLNAGDTINLAALRVVGGALRTNNNECWILVEKLR